MNLSEQQYLVWDTASKNTKRQDILEIFWRVTAPSVLLATQYTLLSLQTVFSNRKEDCLQ